jgi:HK97 gp10 family phage protein
VPAFDPAADLNRLAFDLAEAATAAGTKAYAAIRKTAFDVEATAKQIVPVDTGNLRASIGTDVHAEATAVEAEIGPTAAYGAYVEFGTSRQAPAAFMGPALDRHGYELDAALLELGGLVL